MTQAAKVPEPSMEEILASIRRIIADDDPAPETAAPPPAPARDFLDRPAEPDEATPLPDAEPQFGSDDVLELTETMETPMPGVVRFHTVEAQSDVVFGEPAPAPPQEVPRAMAEPRRQFAPEPPDLGLLSESAAAAVDSAFSSLAQTILVQNGRTLDDVVRELLRPMLKAWLDDNLPNIVERLVRAEIERVSRGRG